MDELPLETGCLSLLELSLLELSLLELSLLDGSIVQTRCRLVLCHPTWSRRPTSSPISRVCAISVRRTVTTIGPVDTRALEHHADGVEDLAQPAAAGWTRVKGRVAELLHGLEVFAALGAAVLISGHRRLSLLEKRFASENEPQLSTQAYRLLTVAGCPMYLLPPRLLADAPPACCRTPNMWRVEQESGASAL